jgi:4-hydroxy-tetrahydrodipicolinate synthase
MAAPLSMGDLRGAIPPAVSTFDAQEDLDLVLFEREMAFMQRSGVDVVAIGGSTGEGSSLTAEEVASLTRVARDQGLRVIAGIITTNTRDAVQRGILASAAGASALLVAPPIYVQPTDAALESFLVDISAAAQLPIVFYDHFFYSPSVLRRVAALPEVIGIKEASVDVIGELAQMAGDQVSIAAGIDPAPIAGLAVGASCVIAGVNAVVPGLAIALFNAFDSGELSAARELLDQIGPLARLMTQPLDFPASVKFAINLTGREVGNPRLPFQPVGETAGAAIKEALAHSGVLDTENAL